jgi:hypothetical protein
VGSNPTLSAIPQQVAKLPSAIEITLRPARAWEALRAADPSWPRTLLRHALPLSLLPALGWPIGQVLGGDLAARPAALAGVFLSSLAFTLASIVVFATAFYLLSPAFGIPRAWRRTVAVAAFASTPVLLTGPLLAFPPMIVASVAALVHCCLLCYLGVQRVLGCRESEAAFFVAAACMLSLVGSLLFAGLCSAAGLV